MKKQLINVGIVVVVAGALVLSMFTSGDRLLPEGSDAPAFDLERLGTEARFNSTELRGHVVLVDFWATWCPPCREELPWLVKVADEYKAKGVEFVAASHDEPDEAKVRVGLYVKDVLPGLGPYAAFGDPIVGGKYRVEALPTLYVIGKDGKVIASAKGETSEWRVRRWLDKALAQQ